MKVVHVTPYFAPAFAYGGPPRSVLGLCQGLQAAGVDVEVVTTVANGSTDLPASPPGGDRYGGIRVHYAARAFPWLYFGAAVREPIRAALATADVCHVHGVWNVPEWEAARASRQHRVPLVISPRGMLHAAAVRRGRWRKRIAFEVLERRNLATAVRVHTTAYDESEELSAFVDRSRMVMIPNGVDLPPVERGRSDFRERFGIPASAPLVVFLGRIHPIKRLDLLIEAMRHATQTTPSARLVIAGPDEGGHLTSLRPQLDRLGGAVHSIGAVLDGDKWALLREAAVLAMCSDSESFGMSVVEAMATGIPVVVTHTCPWREVNERHCGLWVEQTPGAIGDAIVSILENPALAKSMGDNGARLARARYTWPAVAAAMSACYADVLSTSRTGRRVA
jgi:glycosyltransferase involved in cell wall biosynthesis